MPYLEKMNIKSGMNDFIEILAKTCKSYQGPINQFIFYLLHAIQIIYIYVFKSGIINFLIW